jgi:hypothetical protein
MVLRVAGLPKRMQTRNYFSSRCTPSVWFGRTGGVLLLLLGGLAGELLAAPARVEKVRGDVVKRGVSALAWEKVNPGEKVEEGSTLRTGINAQAEVITPQGHRLVVRQETSLEFTSLQDDLTQTRLEKGRVLSKVKKLQGQERFTLQTPTAVCAVRGTEFDTVTGDGGTMVSVFRGAVGVAALGSNREITLQAGQMTSVRNGTIELPRPIPRESQSGAGSNLARAARHEVALDMDRNAVLSAAAYEQRLADYQEGKSLIDVEGKRVRLEEYIVRPQANQFKFVVLNERDNRLDYFFYKGTFNKDLPTDLAVALRDLSGKYGTTAPEYYLTAYEMAQSNTQDSVHDTAAGGHLVQIKYKSDGTYVLTDPTDPTNTRTIKVAELQSDGTYKVYNPLNDSFATVTAADKDANTKFGVYIPENDTFKDLAPGDTYWKTRFNSYSHDLNDINKINYVKSGAANVLASSLDAAWTYAGGFVLPVVEVSADKLDVTITNNYGDNTRECYRTSLIDDQGNLAPRSAFAGVSTGAQYKGELLKWNYEQQVTATEFGGFGVRKIDLVVEPKIFIKSGLIQ